MYCHDDIFVLNFEFLPIFLQKIYKSVTNSYVLSFFMSNCYCHIFVFQDMDSQSPLKSAQTFQEEPSHPSVSKRSEGKVDLRLPEEIKKEGGDCQAPLGLLTPWECLLDKVLQGPHDRDNTQIIENLLEEMSSLITKFKQVWLPFFSILLFVKNN